jgi:hypothetical protein
MLVVARVKNKKLTTGAKAGPITSATSGLNISLLEQYSLVLAYIKARELVETSLGTSSLTRFKRAWSLLSASFLAQIKFSQTYSSDKRHNSQD